MKQLDITDLADLSRQHKNAHEGLERAIGRLQEIMADRAGWRKRDSISVEHYRLRRDLPYCIHETDIKGTQCLVNRNYKPIGSTGSEWAKYEDYTNSHVRLSPEQIASVATNAKGYLFNDGTVPWRKIDAARVYLKRLRDLYRLL